MNKFANKINKVILFCCIIVIFNPVQAIQLDTTQWQEVDITNDFINQSFKQSSKQSISYDSLQLSQTKYANLIRSSSDPGEILIQVLDEYGNQQCSKTIPVVYYGKYSLTNTNVEGEFFLAYTSQASSNYSVFFGFLDETCNFSRGLSSPVQPDDFTGTSFVSILAKNGKDNVYVVSQTYSSHFYLYLMILDISVTTTYSIKKHVKLGTTDFRYNLFNIQAFSDDYAVIFARDKNDKLQMITIEPNGNNVWDTPKNEGLFLDLNTIENYIQNKAIQIENTNKYSIVTVDYNQDIFTIYTFQYNGNGEIQDICLETYSNQFGNVGSQFFVALEFGVINQDFLWVKGDNNNDSQKTVIFFANPLDCQVYRNPDDSSSIYQYQLEHFGWSHIFHTYYSNQTVSLIASSSYIDGKICPQFCSTCIDFENCDSCVSANVQRDVDNQCKCPDKYYQDQQNDDCLECPQYCEICLDQYTCQSCIVSDGERDVSNQCNCKDGYYQDTGSDNCLDCPYFCQTCTDYNTCQSCISSDGERDVSNLCICKDGYYQDGESDNCLECPQYCSNCSDSNTCLSCIVSDGERNLSNLCNCKDGYYQDTQSHNCLECPQYCETCSDSNTCQTCIVSDGERDVSNLCSCKDGYYQDTGSDNCLECPQYCSTCSDSFTCQSCIVSDGERDVSNLCNCKDGYYQDKGSDNCLECPQYCETCSDSSTCQSCIVSDGERDVSSLCTCKDGYYQDTGSDNCLECPQYCSTCSDSSTCQSCIVSDGQRDASNLCNCKDGYYQDKGSDNCLECPQYCETCSDSSTCQSCISSDGERDVSSLCTCKDGYYQDTGSDNCLECPQYCETCSDSSTCQSCIVSDGERDVSSLCTCKDGYYQDTGSDNCLECPQYCSTCSDSSTCQSCIVSDGERDVSSLCTCKDGYYQDTGSDNCLECPQYCSTCSDSSTCQSCIVSDGQRDASNLCNCKDGYYQDKGSDNCLVCPPICDKCSSQNQCETCQNEKFIGPNCNLSKKEYFIDEKKKIKKCHSKCIGCDGESSKCSECQEGNRQDKTNNCDCLPGFHDNMGLYKKCIKCPRFCKNCIDENYCTDCKDGYVLNEITHQCGKCEHGKIWNQFKDQCQECFYYKNQCIFYCPDNTEEGKFNTCIEKVYKEQKSYAKQLIYVGICYNLQLIIFGIFLDRKIKKIIKYVSEEHLNNIKKEYEQMAEEEYQTAIEQNQQQQKNKIKLFDYYLRKDIFEYQKKIEGIFQKIQEHPPNMDSEITKLKKKVSFLITYQSILEQIYKEFIKEHGCQIKKKKVRQQQQIQKNTIANTQNQDSLQIQVQRSQNRPQMKKKMKKRKEKEKEIKEIKKIYNHQDSSSIIIDNKNNDNIKLNNDNNDNDNQNDIEINQNQNNIKKKTFIPLKQ